MSKEIDYKELNNAFMKTRGRLPTEAEKRHFRIMHKVLIYTAIALVVIGLANFFSDSEPESTESIVAKYQQEQKDIAENGAIEKIIMHRDVVKDGLNDPDSAEFTTEAMNLETGVLCYTFRARNQFNGMVRGVASIKNGIVHYDDKSFAKNCPVDNLAAYYFLR